MTLFFLQKKRSCAFIYMYALMTIPFHFDEPQVEETEY